jgi:hypothetical protein
VNRAARAGAAAIAAVLLSALTHAGTPLYDGVGFPDQPYRYVTPPAHAQDRRPPTSEIAVSSPVTASLNSQDLSVQSDEQGPQIMLDLPTGAVHAAPGAHTVTVTVAPKAPNSPPTHARIDGNVYRISVASDVGDATFVAAGDLMSLIYLRAATLTPAAPVMAYRPSPTGRWSVMKTSRNGNDVFGATFRGAGDYAMLHTTGRTPGAGRGSSPLPLLGGLIGGFLLLLAAAAVLSRRPWRTSRRPVP